MIQCTLILFCTNTSLKQLLNQLNHFNRDESYFAQHVGFFRFNSMLNHNFRAITLYHCSCVETAIRHQSTCVVSPQKSRPFHSTFTKVYPIQLSLAYTAWAAPHTLPQWGTKTILNSTTTAPRCGHRSNNELPALTRQTILLAPAASPSDRTVATLLWSIALLPTRATVPSLLPPIIIECGG